VDDEVLGIRLAQLDIGVKKVTDELFGPPGQKGIRDIVISIQDELRSQKGRRERSWQIYAALIAAGITGFIGTTGIFFLWISKQLTILSGA
jgi:hypothetical protein|tara:strand:+ start:398 stop:670 length:273 start_codon:yes stop_codon:yes gene_type:complete